MKSTFLKVCIKDEIIPQKPVDKLVSKIELDI